ncbi:DNA-binding protein [Shouchella clausii]|uniref:DNA-binding protein n=1 Tax=Shouchella clausii TaxID=79880 RepID=UPI001BB2FA28|nr:DNA-binding protein [Shouchella clausii]
MGIYRVSKSNNYVVMDKTALHDERLSWKAKGLHAYMLSMPDDWRFYREELSNHAKDGVDAVKSALKELSDKGYLKRVRRNDENGKLYWETVVYEVPQPEVEKPPVVKPSVDSPLVGKPPVENPLLLNNELLSNELLSNKELKKEKGDKKKPAPQKPSKRTYLDFVKLTEEEREKLIKKFGSVKTDDLIEQLNNYIGSKGDKYKSHYYTLLNWAKRDGIKKGATRNAEPSGRPEYEGYNFDKEFTPNF